MPHNTPMSATDLKVSARLPVEVVEKLEALAARNDRSVAAEIRLAIREHLLNQGANNG